MGYDDVVFKQPLAKHLECPVCLYPLKSPVQTECGHLYCRDCITTIEKQRHPKCPLDKTPLDSSKLFLDNYTNKQLLRLTVLCNNRSSGCEWEGPLSDHQKHAQECMYTPCHCSLNCGQVVPRKDIREHEDKLCVKRTVVCKHCFQAIQSIRLDAHVHTECQEVEVNCHYNCGIPPMARHNMNQHIHPVTGDCPRAVVQCPFYEGGCHQTMLRCQLENHMTNEQFLGKHLLIIGQHFSLTTMKHQDDSDKRLKQVEEKLQRAEALVHLLEDDKNKLQEKVAKMEDKLDRALAIAGALERKVGDLEMALQLTRSEFVTLELQFQQNTSQTDISRILGTNMVTDAVDEADGRHAVPRSLVALSKPALISTLQPVSQEDYHILADLEASKQKLRDIEKQLRSMDHMTAARDISMAEQDLRLQALETSFYDGILLWKISNFRRRRQDAACGRIPSLYSPPFFTNRKGYKMCSRAYLDGDGIGKGTHLSLFFTVMKGEFDALLPWPFNQRVTLMVLDQSVQQRHTQDTFRPDQQSSSFQRPVNDMNIASGCPLFIPLDDLERKGYVKDDTLFVCVKVDCSNLQQF